MSSEARKNRLELPDIQFASPLTDIIIELDYLRKKKLGGTTPSYLFFQLKHIFHTLESLGSARIEGNRTTVMEFVETKIANNKSEPIDSIREITNMEKAMDFIEAHAIDAPIDRMFISELHKMVVDGLVREGDVTPGEFRKTNVRIAKATHVPPDFTQVSGYMDELYEFISRPDAPKYDLLKTAIAHHRFAWIHPFNNGNGRTVRLLTYAMLVRQGFNVDKGRIVNPTAVFCSDRDRYYDELAKADAGDIQSWSMYVLSGLKIEIEKVDKLTKYKYLKDEIILPAILWSLEQNMISSTDAKILTIAVEKESFSARDIAHLFEGKLPQQISKIIRHLRERKLIVPMKTNSYRYGISFANSFLLRGVMFMLDKNGFLPISRDA